MFVVSYMLERVDNILQALLAHTYGLAGKQPSWTSQKHIYRLYISVRVQQIFQKIVFLIHQLATRHFTINKKAQF